MRVRTSHRLAQTAPLTSVSCCRLTAAACYGTFRLMFDVPGQELYTGRAARLCGFNSAHQRSRYFAAVKRTRATGLHRHVSVRRGNVHRPPSSVPRLCNCLCASVLPQVSSLHTYCLCRSIPRTPFTRLNVCSPFRSLIESGHVASA